MSVYMVHGTQSLEGKDEFEHLEAAKKQAAKHYRGVTKVAGAPVEVTYYIFDLDKAETVASITPPPILTWREGK